MDADFATTLLANMPDAVVHADRMGAIRYWNRGAARIFGHTEDEALGQSLDLIIPERLRARAAHDDDVARDRRVRLRDAHVHEPVDLERAGARRRLRARRDAREHRLLARGDLAFGSDREVPIPARAEPALMKAG